MRTYLPVPFDEAKAANYKIHCNFYAKSGADGVYTFKYNVDDSARTTYGVGARPPRRSTSTSPPTKESTCRAINRPAGSLTRRLN